jgi:hypothetical protein
LALACWRSYRAWRELLVAARAAAEVLGTEGEADVAMTDVAIDVAAVVGDSQAVRLNGSVGRVTPAALVAKYARVAAAYVVPRHGCVP